MTESSADSNEQVEISSLPRSYVGVMVSSTFTDLKNHRAALIRAINGEELKPLAMEFDAAKPVGDVIDSSLQMVRNSAAYIAVISRKYGQIPQCRERNPNNLSLTELEFNEARRLQRPILVFVMGDDHDVKFADIESDPEKANKLAAFRENVKLFREDSAAHRVYNIFNNLHEFELAATHSLAELRRTLEPQYKEQEPINAIHADSNATFGAVPEAPILYAIPPYIGSHAFVGRAEQLETLTEWASPADPHPLVLYEAIGGVGKSILAWEWTTKYALAARSDWAGRFWYSFYEKGATMVDFCRRALAYMTGQPRVLFREKNTAELTEPIIQQLRNQSWLLILDGLERILVSYHRFDAAQVPDDQAGNCDVVANRDPCATINPEDEDLLRGFAAASPSKILITSRLSPRALLNRSRQPIPGTLRERLPGLRPADAESLIRSCGVTGDSKSIQAYLKSQCDCHPLVIGVLAGLITDYLPDRGNFDAWVLDPNGGGKLNLANLDLVQKRNHILSCALLALPEPGRKLLAILALLSESVDSTTLYALNPDPPALEEMVEPTPPEWWKLSAEERSEAREEYQRGKQCYEIFKADLARRNMLVDASASNLSDTVRDLERRGLLQYDSIAKHYDLHPVVRGYAAGGLEPDEINRYGRRVVDHFSQRARNPYTEAERLEDFDNARHIVKVLFQMGEMEKAKNFILGNNFLQVISSKFEAHNEILTIIKPFFDQGWSIMPSSLEKKGGASLTKRAAIALRRIGAFHEAFEVSETALKMILRKNRKDPLASHLISLASTAGELNRLTLEDRLLRSAEEIAFLEDRRNGRISFLLARFRQLSVIGDFSGASEVWSRLNNIALTRQERAIASHHHAVHLFLQGTLTSAALREAEELNSSVDSALGVRNLCALRGFWFADKGEWQSARLSLQEAVARAHKANKFDRRSEIRLAIANYHLGKLSNPDQVAEEFTRNVESWGERSLAELWFSIGNRVEARKHANAAYRWAFADGEPFVRRNELDKTRELFSRIGGEPTTPKSTRITSVNWEDELKSCIQLRRSEAIVQEGGRKSLKKRQV